MVELSELQSLYGISQQPLILDVRPHDQFLQQRLAGSVNIPLPGLTKRCYLLPDKATAFTVVLPSTADYTVTTDQSQHNTVQQDGSTAVWLKGATSLPDFLSSRGWTSVSTYLQAGPQLWSAAAQLSVLEQGPPADPQQLARRCLFAPSGLVAASIAQIEAALVALVNDRLHQQQLLPQQPQPQQQQQQEQGATVLRALDVGCGSGRDVAWLASRQIAVGDQQQQLQQRQPPEQQQPQQVQAGCDVHWHVTGVDEWLGALERAAELAEAMSLGPDRVCLSYARTCTETGAIQQLQVPKKSKLNKSAFASCAVPHSDDSSTFSPQDSLTGPYHLIMCCRFLVRALLPKLSEMLNPGGFVLYSTFLDLPGVQAFGRPSGAEHLLQQGELSGKYFGPGQGFEVLLDIFVTAPDGREVCWFMARKK